MKAVIVAFDNFTDIDIFLAWDLLNRVKHRDKNFEVKIVGTQAYIPQAMELNWICME